MGEDYIAKTTHEISQLKNTREAYKKRFWIKSKRITPEKKKSIKKLFMKIDRLRNHLKLWLKHLVNNKPTNYYSYVQLINRSKNEINTSFKQLDKMLTTG